MAPLSTLSYAELHALVQLVDGYAAVNDDDRAAAWREMAHAELRRRFDVIDEQLRLSAEVRAARDQPH